MKTYYQFANESIFTRSFDFIYPKIEELLIGLHKAHGDLNEYYKEYEEVNLGNDREKIISAARNLNHKYIIFYEHRNWLLSFFNEIVDTKDLNQDKIDKIIEKWKELEDNFRYGSYRDPHKSLFSFDASALTWAKPLLKLSNKFLKKLNILKEKFDINLNTTDEFVLTPKYGDYYIPCRKSFHDKRLLKGNPLEDPFGEEIWENKINESDKFTFTSYELAQKCKTKGEFEEKLKNLILGKRVSFDNDFKGVVVNLNLVEFITFEEMKKSKTAIVALLRVKPINGSDINKFMFESKYLYNNEEITIMPDPKQLITEDDPFGEDLWENKINENEGNEIIYLWEIVRNFKSKEELKNYLINLLVGCNVKITRGFGSFSSMKIIDLKIPSNSLIPFESMTTVRGTHIAILTVVGRDRDLLQNDCVIEILSKPKTNITEEDPFGEELWENKIFKKLDKDNFIENLNINFKDFDLFYEQFDHKSTVHGINHVFRVMLYCIVIGRDINDIQTTRRAFMAAYIHDMARKHDYACMVHGINSAKFKLPMYTDLFIKNGATREDIKAIELAVSNHSQHHEIDKTDPYYKTVALLRDSDGLDLVRLDREINPKILRFKESKKYIDKATALFEKTDNKNYNNFYNFMINNIDML